MDIALVEHAQHDIDGEQRRGDQERLVGQRLLEDLRGALEAAVDRRRHVQAAPSPASIAAVASLSDDARRQVERDRAGDEQALVVDRERRVAGLEMGDGRERHHGLAATVLTAAPVEVALRPVLASELLAALRAASPAICAAVAAAALPCAGAVLATTVPASALVACVPLTAPPGC